MKTLGFIGLGKMGRGMCRNLIRAGYSLSVYDKDSAAAAAFSETACVRTSPSEVFEKGEVVFFSLPSSLVVKSIIKEIPAEGIRGKTVVDMSTGDPFDSREFYSYFQEHGGEYADSPVTGDPEAAERGQINTAFGGDETVFERVRPLMSAFCNNCVYMGGSGSGALTKVAANYIGVQYIAIYTQIFSLAQKMELNPQKLYDFISENTGMGCGALRFHGPKIIGGNREVAFAVELALKDLLYAKKLFDSFNTPAFTLDGAIDLLRTALKDGAKGRDITCCADVVKEYLGKEDSSEKKV